MGIMKKYGISIEHSNGKTEWSEYQGKQRNIDRIEQVKDFYHKKGSRVFLIELETTFGGGYGQKIISKTEF